MISRRQLYPVSHRHNTCTAVQNTPFLLCSGNGHRYSSLQAGASDPLVAIRGPTSKGREWEEDERGGGKERGERRKGERRGKGREGEAATSKGREGKGED